MCSESNFSELLYVIQDLVDGCTSLCNGNLVYRSRNQLTRDAAVVVAQLREIMNIRFIALSYANIRTSSLLHVMGLSWSASRKSWRRYWSAKKDTSRVTKRN
jgi:hypothetical protein